jgi:hypothetical protein
MLDPYPDPHIINADPKHWVPILRIFRCNKGIKCFAVWRIRKICFDSGPQCFQIRIRSIKNFIIIWIRIRLRILNTGIMDGNVPVRQKKCFSFQVFSLILYNYNSVFILIGIRNVISDSDSAKIFGLRILVSHAQHAGTDPAL